MIGALSLFTVEPAEASHTPATPINFQAQAGNAQVTLTWGGGFGATTYDLAHGEHPSGTLSTQTITAAARKTATITGLTNETAYRFRVRVRASSGHTASAWTSFLTATPSSRTRSTNTNLSGLTAGSSTSSGGQYTNFSIGTFGATTTTYTASVANDQTHVKLTPTVADTGKATVGVRKGNSGNFDAVTSGMASSAIALDVGANTLVVRVTAEDTTTTKDYTITVTRQTATRSTNANLSGLTAGSNTSSTGTFTNFSIGTFAATDTSYTATVANDQTHVKLTPTVADTGKATVGVRKGTSGNFDTVTSGSASSAIALDVGANTLVVRVTAEDTTTTKDYTVTVTRQSAVQAPPTGLTVTPGDAQLRVSWTAPSNVNDISGYDLHFTSAAPADVANNAAASGSNPAVAWVRTAANIAQRATSHTIDSDDATLTNGVTYRVRLRVTFPESVYVFSSGTPVAPQSTNADLSALAVGSSTSSGGQYTNFSIGTFGAMTTSYSASVANDQTHVKLTPTVDDTGKATVGVRKGAGSFTPVTSGLASSAIALDVGANTLVVRVTAEDTTTTKDYTVTVTRQSTQTQAAPTGLTVTPGDAQLRVSWTAPSGSFTGYQLDITSATVRTVANGAAASGSNPATAWITVATPVSTSTSHTIDSNAVTLTNGRLYRVRLRTTTPDSAWVFSTGTPQGAPDAPIGLTVTAGNARLNLAWTAPAGTVTGYDVHYTSAAIGNVADDDAAGTDPAAAWVAASRSSTDRSVSHAIPGLTNDILYRVRVRAKNSAGHSLWVTGSGTPDPTATEEVSAALNLSLDGLSRTLLSGAVGVIGERIAASDEPEAAMPELTDADAWISATGLRPSPADASSETDAWRDPHAHNSDRVTGTISWNRFFAFSLDAPNGSQSQTADSQWRMWGTGDLQNFRRADTSAASRGGWNTVYLGLERRVVGHWLGGLALASGRGKADYSYSEGAAEGRLELRLKAAYPYFRAVTAEGVEVWAMAGAGQGRATNTINGQEPHSGRLRMRMATAGFRLRMADWRSALLSALVDAGAATLRIRGEQSLANLKSSVRRVRAGLELSGQGGEWSPYTRLNVRHEGGGGLSAAGLETEAGARYSHGRLGMDVRMRWMRLTGSRKYRESGAAATLRISPAADGTGLSLTLSPSRGRPDGTDLVWRASPLPSETPARAGNGLAMTVEVGYGIRPLQLPGLVTPTLGYARGAQGDERLRVGADYTTELPYEFSLGFGLERSETLGVADQNIRLDATMRW